MSYKRLSFQELLTISCHDQPVIQVEILTLNPQVAILGLDARCVILWEQDRRSAVFQRASQIKLPAQTDGNYVAMALDREHNCVFAALSDGGLQIINLSESDNEFPHKLVMQKSVRAANVPLVGMQLSQNLILSTATQLIQVTISNQQVQPAANLGMKNAVCFAFDGNNTVYAADQSKIHKLTTAGQQVLEFERVGRVQVILLHGDLVFAGGQCLSVFKNDVLLYQMRENVGGIKFIKYFEELQVLLMADETGQILAVDANRQVVIAQTIAHEKLNGASEYQGHIVTGGADGLIKLWKAW